MGWEVTPVTPETGRDYLWLWLFRNLDWKTLRWVYWPQVANFLLQICQFLREQKLSQLIFHSCPGEGWRCECGAGDVSQCLQSWIPGVRSCRSQASVWLRRQSWHQVHWDILQRSIRSEALHHRQLLSKPGDHVPGQQQPPQPQPRGLQALAQARLPHPGEHHGGEHCSLPRGIKYYFPVTFEIFLTIFLSPQEVGSQLRGLKIQCNGFDLSDIAVLCPNLKSLIIQKEAPNPGQYKMYVTLLWTF